MSDTCLYIPRIASFSSTWNKFMKKWIVKRSMPLINIQIDTVYPVIFEMIYFFHDHIYIAKYSIYRNNIWYCCYKKLLLRNVISENNWCKKKSYTFSYFPKFCVTRKKNGYTVILALFTYILDACNISFPWNLLNNIQV